MPETTKSQTADEVPNVDSLLSPELDPLFFVPERLDKASAWWSHVPFASWTVAACRPRLLVELGTENGVSYAAFCEAVTRCRTETRCYAVDTWLGDPHAQFYGEDVYENFLRFHDERYAGFSTLIRSTFDDAVSNFSDGSIDLLHIDGYHTYDAVRHDFETWYPKLSDRGVVLFHDTNVRERDFGVSRVFEEASQRFPSFEFLHGSGLGVLSVGGAVPAPIARLCSLTRSSDINRFRERFAYLGARWSAEWLTRVSQEREQEARRSAADVERRMADTLTQVRAAEMDAETRIAEAQARDLAEAERIVAEGNAKVVSATQQLQVEQRRYESEIASLRREIQAVNSTMRGASVSLRIAASWFPSSLKRAARCCLRSIYWVLTPWATPRRIRAIRERLRQRQGAVAPDVGHKFGLRISSTFDVLGSRLSVAPRVVPSLLPATGGLAPATAGFSVVYVSGEPDTPGHQYRVERYVAAAAASGCTAYWIRGDELPHRLNELWGADVLVIWRMAWREHVAAAVAQMRAHQKRVVFDVDDLMVDPDLAKVKIIDGIRSQFLTERSVRQHYAAVRETMLASDICFAATDELALHMRRAGKVVHVLPNGFDNATHSSSRLAARRWRQQRQDNLIRFGYAGGTRTHQRDLGVAIEAIAQLLKEYSNCRLVLYRSPDGARPVIDIEEFPTLLTVADQIEWRSLRPLSDLPEEIARFDINLAPLEFGNPYCEAKSELKFFEAALVDVPTIASPTGPYRRAIEHGKTGFLAANTDEWYAYGKRLIEDPELRGRVGREAYIEALARFGSTARSTRFGRVVAQLRGGTAAAHAFALDSQLSGKRRSRPAILPNETVLERDGLGIADVTVVIPLYNYANYVTEALDSVCDQTLRALDLVVVDDCSTDRSLSVAIDWAEKNAGRFNRICVLKNGSNQGLAMSRNSGFDAADTPYVLPLDPDNKLLSQCCEILLNTIRTSGAAFAYSAIRRFGDGEGLVSAVGYDAQRFVGSNYIDAMALVSKEAWATVGGYHHIQVVGWEDYDFWCRLAEHGLAGAWHSDVLALYRVHGTSMLQTHTMVPVNYRRLVEDFTTRHPWVSLTTQ